MKNQTASSTPTDLAPYRFRKEHANQMGALGWNQHATEGLATELVNPVHFYLYDPLVSGESYYAATNLDTVTRLAENGLSGIDMPPKAFGELVQACAIDLLWDSESNDDTPQNVVQYNLINFLTLKTGKQLLKTRLKAGESYVFGMMYYINEKDGHVIASTARPMGGKTRSPLTPQQVEDLALPYIQMDIKNHPDYLTRYPIKQYLTNLIKTR